MRAGPYVPSDIRLYSLLITGPSLLGYKANNTSSRILSLFTIKGPFKRIKSGMNKMFTKKKSLFPTATDPCCEFVIYIISANLKKKNVKSGIHANGVRNSHSSWNLGVQREIAYQRRERTEK